MAAIQRAFVDQAITFSSGSSESSAADIRKLTDIGLITSTAFGSSQVSFRVARSSGGTYYDLYDRSTQVLFTVSTNSARADVITDNPNVFKPWGWLKVVGNSTGDSARTWYVQGK